MVALWTASIACQVCKSHIHKFRIVLFYLNGSIDSNDNNNDDEDNDISNHHHGGIVEGIYRLSSIVQHSQVEDSDFHLNDNMDHKNDDNDHCNRR